ncbi:MAG: shikimate kinase [Gemmatimonadales bacterium]
MLIGLPGAGKTSVAPHVARALGSSWCDIDHRVVLQARRTISDIFLVYGEAHFRALERAAMEAALAEDPQVIATGGGWASEPGNVAAVADRVLLVYLSLSPEEAARRIAGSNDRPLLSLDASVPRMAELLAARKAWYRMADIEIAAGDASPETVAAGVVTAAHQYGGW